MAGRHLVGLICAAALVFVAIGRVVAGEVPPVAYYDYEKYKTQPHYRAFAMTRLLGSVASGWGWTYGYGNVESAIINAIKRCEAGKAKYDTIHECKLHSIGDIDVYSMKKGEVDTAIKLYKKNRNATNKDLTGFISE